jgi:poly(A) polymerase
VLGYPGGFAWAILVANICIIFPYLEPNKLLHNFFRYYSNWDWNADNPIILTEIRNDRLSSGFHIDSSLFYTKNPNDLMPIITPAFPSMNSTYNVSQSTKKALLTEFEKAFKIVDALEN